MFINIIYKEMYRRGYLSSKRSAVCAASRTVGPARRCGGSAACPVCLSR
jgi:hypothetical protein